MQQELTLVNDHDDLGCHEQFTSRVALLTNILPPYLAPVFRHLAERIGELRIFLSVPMEPDRPWPAKWDGLDVAIQKSFSARRRHRHPQGFVSDVMRHFPWDTLPQLANFRPDVVISAQLGPRTIQSAIYRLFSRRARFVIWVDGSEHTEKAFGPARTFLRRVLVRAADAVLVIGQSGERYVKRLGVDPSRIVQIPFVTDMEPFEALPLERDASAERRLLYVGRLVEGKGLVPFVQDLARYVADRSEEQRELWFLGDGPLRNELAQMRVPSRLTLKFLGNVPYEDLAAYYAQCSICVLPTLADTWGLVVNEALAAGLPVLGSLYSQAVEQLVRAGENGWTYYPDTPDGTERALHCALSTTGERLASMRSAARATVTHLTPRYAARHFLKVIALAQSKPGTSSIKSAESALGKP